MRRVLGWPASQLLSQDLIVGMKKNEGDVYTNDSQSVVTGPAARYPLGPY